MFNRLLIRFPTVAMRAYGARLAGFYSINGLVKEIRVIASSFEDDGNNTDDAFYILWCDLFSNSPVAIVGSNTSTLTPQPQQPNGSNFSRIQFNPPRNINGQFNFRLTRMDYLKTPISFVDIIARCCVIMEFIF